MRETAKQSLLNLQQKSSVPLPMMRPHDPSIILGVSEGSVNSTGRSIDLAEGLLPVGSDNTKVKTIFIPGLSQLRFHFVGCVRIIDFSWVKGAAIRRLVGMMGTSRCLFSTTCLQLDCRLHLDQKHLNSQMWTLKKQRESVFLWAWVPEQKNKLLLPSYSLITAPCSGSCVV